MFTAAMIIYIIGAIFLGPFWPLDLLGWKAGPIGFILGLGWLSLFIGGLTS